MAPLACDMIYIACSRELSKDVGGGEGAEENMNFLNSLRPTRPRGQEGIPSTPNHET